MPRGTITWRWRPPMSDLDDSLRRSTLRGGAWMAGATAVVALFQAIKLIVLARYLEPVDFGLMAIVGVIAGFSHTLADGGMSNAIVSRPDLDQRQLSSLYWFNVLAGLAVALTLVVLAQPLALFFGEASLRELIIVSASVFLFKALGNQFRLLLQRELVFAPIAAAAVSSEAIGLAVAVPLAMAGHGAWALVASLVTTAAAAAIVYAVIGLYRYPRPLLRLSFDDLRSLYAYGSYQVGERIINYLSAHIDKVLIGKLVGPSALGFYDLAWQVVAFPLNRINPTVHNVLFPRLRPPRESGTARALLRIRPPRAEPAAGTALLLPRVLRRRHHWPRFRRWLAAERRPASIACARGSGEIPGQPRGRPDTCAAPSGRRLLLEPFFGAWSWVPPCFLP
jgi:hypothetical protein